MAECSARTVIRPHGEEARAFSYGGRTRLSGKRAPSRTMRAARCLSMLAAFACFASHAAQSEDAYPTKPVRLIVGFAAGGPTDFPARYIADELGKRLGKRLVVQNKPGAGGI